MILEFLMLPLPLCFGGGVVCANLLNRRNIVVCKHLPRQGQENRPCSKCQKLNVIIDKLSLINDSQTIPGAGCELHHVVDLLSSSS